MSEPIPSTKVSQQDEKTNNVPLYTDMICILCKQKFYTNDKHECCVKDDEKIVRIR